MSLKNITGKILTEQEAEYALAHGGMAVQKLLGNERVFHASELTKFRKACDRAQRRNFLRNKVSFKKRGKKSEYKPL